MVGIAIDLVVVEPGGADRLRGTVGANAGGPATAIAVMPLELVEPRRQRGGGYSSVRFLLQAGRLFERVAEVVVGDGREDHAQRIGLIVQRSRTRCEGALAGSATPQLHD